MNKLPEQCYNTLRSTGELVTIRKNEKGYFPSELSTPDMLTNRPLPSGPTERLGSPRLRQLPWSAVLCLDGHHPPRIQITMMPTAILSADVSRMNRKEQGHGEKHQRFQGFNAPDRSRL